MPLSRPLPRTLAGVALLAAAALVLLVAGWTLVPPGWDPAILAWVRARAGAGVLRAATDVTALGGGVVLTLVVAAAAGLLLVERLWLTAGLLVAATWTGGRVVSLVKDAVARARPDVVDHLVPVASASFPSGHAANSAVVYLTLAALGSQVVRGRGARRYLFGCAILLSLLIGASRVMLGVHWPSDVLAGWSFGALWATGWWWAAARARTAIGGER